MNQNKAYKRLLTYREGMDESANKSPKDYFLNVMLFLAITMLVFTILVF